MAAAHDEYHNNVEEYFPINDPVKGKRNFNRKSAGAVGVMLTASAGIIAAALTLLLLFCSATAVSPSSASFQTTVCNADDSTQIHYYVVPYDAVSQNPEIAYFDDFDYVFGDYSYGKLRLKGFFESNSKKCKKYNNIDFYKKYLEEFCAKECPYFLIKKKITIEKK